MHLNARTCGNMSVNFAALGSLQTGSVNCSRALQIVSAVLHSEHRNEKTEQKSAVRFFMCNRDK